MPFVAQISATICLLCVIGYFVGDFFRSPYPNIMEWGDWVGFISCFVGGASFLVFLLALIWR